ncbi:MAG: alpha/beta hydrolase [Rhodospirillaceae bacterium]|nr:alpha/beta hydrolase [Rhodospirillaceae bacterium]
MTSFEEKYYVSFDGLRLYYRSYTSSLNPKKRPMILCLSGLTRNSGDFHELSRQYKESFNIVCVDYRGRGLSEYDKNWQNYRAEIYIRDLLQLLSQFSQEKLIVIGTSMGGLLGMGLTQFIPNRILGMVLNDIGPAIIDNGLERIIQYIRLDNPQKSQREALQWLLKLYPLLGKRPQEQQDNFVKSTYRLREDGLLHYNWDTNIALALQKESNHPIDLWKFFRELSPRPVLGFRGELSDVLSPETFKKMGQELASFTPVTVAGVGHTPFLNEPECKVALRKFLGQFE